MPSNAPGSTDLMGEGGKTGKADWVAPDWRSIADALAEQLQGVVWVLREMGHVTPSEDAALTAYDQAVESAQ